MHSIHREERAVILRGSVKQMLFLQINKKVTVQERKITLN